MVDLWSCYNHEGEVFWSCKLRPWEIEEVKSLDNIISSIRLNAKEDLLIWISGGKQFSKKDGMSLWRKIDSYEDWQWKFIWKLQVPPNIKLFLWKVHSAILPTRSFLRMRIRIQFSDSQFLLCNSAEETKEHLLWKCSTARKIWQEVLTWWGLLDKVYVEDMHTMWRSIKVFRVKILSKMWETVLAATTWTIWLTRNERSFYS